MIGEDCVGFLFDGEITKTERCVNIHGRSIRFLSIDDDPGHVQVTHRSGAAPSVGTKLTVW